MCERILNRVVGQEIGPVRFEQADVQNTGRQFAYPQTEIDEANASGKDIRWVTILVIAIALLIMYRLMVGLMVG